MKNKACCILILLCFTNLYGLEIKVKNTIESIESNPIGCFSVLDCFYDSSNSLIIVFERQSNTNSVFKINKDKEIEIIKYEEIDYKYGTYHSYIKEGISYELIQGYKVVFSSSEIGFNNFFIETQFGNNPKPYYMYVFDKNDKIIFNFNTWRLDKSEFYPKSYYNSMSEEKEYTLEEQKKVLQLHPASTEWKKHTAINKKQNRIAVIFDKYNGKRGALVIFEILYDAVCNDDKVRLRIEPNLNCETISYLNKNDAIKIKDQTDKKSEISGEKWYWYLIETSDGKTGWVYGKYLDIEE